MTRTEQDTREVHEGSVARTILYRIGETAPIRSTTEDALAELPAESMRGGLREPKWLVDDHYTFPRRGHDRLRLCPQEQAEELERIEAQMRDLIWRRREVREEAWRRADRYRGRS